MELIEKRCSQCNFYKCNIHTFPITEISQEILECSCSFMDYIWKIKNKNALEIFIKLLLLYIDDKKENKYKIDGVIEKLVYIVFNKNDVIIFNETKDNSNEEAKKEYNYNTINNLNNNEENGGNIDENYYALKMVNFWIKKNLDSISTKKLNYILNKLNWYLQCFIFNSNESLLNELIGMLIYVFYFI